MQLPVTLSSCSCVNAQPLPLNRELPQQGMQYSFLPISCLHVPCFHAFTCAGLSHLLTECFTVLQVRISTIPSVRWDKMWKSPLETLKHSTAVGSQMQCWRGSSAVAVALPA